LRKNQKKKEGTVRRRQRKKISFMTYEEAMAPGSLPPALLGED
jgi:hypothetical protein